MRPVLLQLHLDAVREGTIRNSFTFRCLADDATELLKLFEKSVQEKKGVKMVDAQEKSLISS